MTDRIHCGVFLALSLLALGILACTPSEQRMPPSRHPELHCELGSFHAVDDGDQPVVIPRPGAFATVLDFWASGV
jgi:hypothetical protein